MPKSVTEPLSPARWPVPLPDQAGRVALITGATSGIGLECAGMLGDAGAEVIMAGRSETRATRVANRLRELVPDGAFRYEHADLADLSSVRALARRLLHQNRPVSLLMHCVSLRTPPGERRHSVDGFELQFAVNHLAPFALTGLLLPLLRLAEQPRVVAAGSLAAARATIHLEDLQRIRGLSGAYGQSKLAQLMFVNELGRRSLDYGWGVKALAAHPGHLTKPRAGQRSGWFSHAVGVSRTAADAAQPFLLAATDPEARSGDYYGLTQRLGQGPATRVPMPAGATHRLVARRLWDRSEDLSGVAWPKR